VPLEIDARDHRRLPRGAAHVALSLPLTLRFGRDRLAPRDSDYDAAAAYTRYAVPETGQIFYEGGFANFHLHPPTEVHFKSEGRAPLLIVGATDDHTVPASLAKAQYKR
jgi:hypothetical protein